MLNKELVELRKSELLYYSPFNFLREIESEVLLEPIMQDLQLWQQTGKLLFEFQGVQFFYTYLSWDSAFFGKKTGKLNYVLFQGNLDNLVRACRRFVQQLSNDAFDYLFTEIPSEDILLIQALNVAGLKSSETRLVYFHDQVQQFTSERFDVRPATDKDIPNLRNVAIKMRNRFDRFHADPCIEQDAGDSFLAKYVEEGVKGYNDVVLVPAESGLPSDSFFSLNLMEKDWRKLGTNVSKIVLTAASSDTNRGWHYKLLVESLHWLKSKGSEVVYMPTQSTNRAVIRNCEKAGFKYGGSSHVLTCDLASKS